MPADATPRGDADLATHIFRSTKELPWEDWYHVVSPENLLWNQVFFQGIEATVSPQTQHYYVLIYEYGKPIFCAYFQQIPFVTRQISSYTKSVAGGSSLRDWWKSQMSNSARRLVQLFRFRLLVNGTPMLTGETGFQAIPSLPPSRVQTLLFTAAETVQSQAPRSIGTLIKDLYQAKKEESWDSILSQQQYHHFLPDPEMWFLVPPTWNCWEDYLGAMSSKYRQRAKSAYKKSQGILQRELSLDEIAAFQDQLFQLFQQVLTQEKFSLCDVRPDFLFQLKSSMQDRFLVHGYFEEDRLVGFTSQLKGEGTLLTHFIGYETALNSSRKLYQRMLYDQVRLALAFSDSIPYTLSLGRTAMEIKSAIGALPQAVPCYLRLQPSWLNRLATPVLSNLNIQPWTPRHPFKQPMSVI